jgi:hypothetical protein
MEIRGQSPPKFLARPKLTVTGQGQCCTNTASLFRTYGIADVLSDERNCHSSIVICVLSVATPER